VSHELAYLARDMLDCPLDLWDRGGLCSCLQRNGVSAIGDGADNVIDLMRGGDRVSVSGGGGEAGGSSGGGCCGMDGLFGSGQGGPCDLSKMGGSRAALGEYSS